jgi:tetratricopeptide (TPR) repeat protein
LDDFFGNLWANAFGGLIVTVCVALFAWKRWPVFFRGIKARDLPPAEGSHFTILVAELEDDTPDRKQTKHVISSLRQQFSVHAESRAFEVRDYPKSLRAGIAGNLVEIDRAAEQKGRDWLNEQNADLLIWGEVAEANNIIRLRFLPRDGQSSQQKSYALTNLLELPLEFKAELGNFLTGIVLLTVAPVFAATHSLIKLLSPLLPRLKNLVEHGREELSAECYASVCNGAAVAFLVFGEQSGQSNWMKESEAAFSKTIETFDRDDYPEQWATAHSNLGALFATQGQRLGGDVARDFMEKSIVAFESALLVQTRKNSPIEWARSQGNLGNAYRILALSSAENKIGGLFEKSRQAIFSALKVHTKEDMPFDWAVGHLNLSVLYRDIGIRTDGASSQEFLEEAIKAACLALEFLTPDNYPLQWAMAKSSLGATAGISGERGVGDAATELLRISVSSFENTLKIYTHKEFPDHRAMNQVNLGNALCVLGNRSQDQSAFVKAVSAFKDALSFYKQSGFESAATKTRKNLALAEAELLKLQ